MKEIAIGLAARKQDNEIARSDQMNANRFLSRYDLNRDKHIDLEEIEQTGWPKDPASFDTGQDDKITVFEIALRFAKNRKERGVEQQDRYDIQKRRSPQN